MSHTATVTFASLVTYVQATTGSDGGTIPARTTKTFYITDVAVDIASGNARLNYSTANGDSGPAYVFPFNPSSGTMGAALAAALLISFPGNPATITYV
jgi:hypothetical protein